MNWRSQTNPGMYTDHDLKLIINTILSQELNCCKYKIEASFEWTYSSRLFAIHINNEKIELWMNLNGIRKEMRCLHLPCEMAVQYCAYFITSYIHEMETVTERIPNLYFDGLVLLNLITDYKSEKKIGIFSPIGMRDNLQKKSILRPLEIHCALLALKRIVPMDTMGEAENIISIRNELILYSILPEVSYEGSKIPEHSLFNELRRIVQLIKLDASVVEEIAILHHMFQHEIKMMSLDSIWKRYIDTENGFYLGITVRMLCYMYPVCELDCMNEKLDQLQDAVNEYRRQSVSYFQACEMGMSKILKDNFLVIRDTAGKANHLLEQYEMVCESGTIHTY